MQQPTFMSAPPQPQNFQFGQSIAMQPQYPVQSMPQFAIMNQPVPQNSSFMQMHQTMQPPCYQGSQTPQLVHPPHMMQPSQNIQQSQAKQQPQQTEPNITMESNPIYQTSIPGNGSAAYDEVQSYEHQYTPVIPNADNPPPYADYI